MALSSVAEHFGTGNHSLLKLFREGGQRRIIHAQRLLEKTDLGLDRIAWESGFGSAAVLRQNFARTLGTTPTAYRATFSCRMDEAEVRQPELVA